MLVRTNIVSSRQCSGYEWDSEAFRVAGAKMGAEFDAFYVGTPKRRHRNLIIVRVQMIGSRQESGSICCRWVVSIA